MHKLQVILEMTERTAARLRELEGEKRRMGEALEASTGELKKVKGRNAELAAGGEGRNHQAAS